MKRILLLALFTLPVVFTIVFQSVFSADENKYDVMSLKAAGKITSLEMILEKLSSYDIDRLLEIELEQEDNRYIYEIEYVNSKGVVHEIEVDAVTAQVLKTEREY
ncbi:MAG: PepSY domain-containing protein [gamma proteobacterium symbiont of Lucinoma myriamae]|nr:PepSY domain-containing protein [gamma proteobacterium symbiont of Lucinoma myriamae]MCU7819205.1 PepSY domain-containing protein [gamma proteobacterium symbiont of Lucinoma myriamae]MCU7833124.1 PepSY domain-containing protein [gamma proteobacterium symbiont of Lucinoma myriamae]